MQKIIVTGALGFVGSSFIRWVMRNQPSVKHIIAIDALRNPDALLHNGAILKLPNVEFCTGTYVDLFDSYELPKDIDAIFHFGAISDTRCRDMALLQRYNIQDTFDWIGFAEAIGCPIVYASSSAIHGNHGYPLNAYAVSKLVVDQDVERNRRGAIGARLFNVAPFDWRLISSDVGALETMLAPEDHKSAQRCFASRFASQAIHTGIIEVYEGSEGFFRDVIFVERVCELVWKLAQGFGVHYHVGKVYDVGTGLASNVMDVAVRMAALFNARVQTVPMPEELRKQYQKHTVADMWWV